MNVPLSQRAGRFRVSSLIGGSILALAVISAGGGVSPQASAAPALFCAPVDASFGISSDGDSQERLDLPQTGTPCRPVATGANNSASSAQSNQMAAPAAAQQDGSNVESVWMSVYRAQANDKAQ